MLFSFFFYFNFGFVIQSKFSISMQKPRKMMTVDTEFESKTNCGKEKMKNNMQNKWWWWHFDFINTLSKCIFNINKNFSFCCRFTNWCEWQKKVEFLYVVLQQNVNVIIFIRKKMKIALAAAYVHMNSKIKLFSLFTLALIIYNVKMPFFHFLLFEMNTESWRIAFSTIHFVSL